jgi:Rad3-related DNA helicase
MRLLPRILSKDGRPPDARFRFICENASIKEPFQYAFRNIPKISRTYPAVIFYRNLSRTSYRYLKNTFYKNLFFAGCFSKPLRHL